jgi:predicted MFS family arabinose efflux permease
MAAGCGACIANIYYNQPLLLLLERTFGGTLTDLVPTVTQLGYAAGLLLLVPLGDALERRRLIAVQIVALTVSLVLLALAPDAAVLLAASAAVGVTASVVQQIVPFAAELAPPGRRGRVVGTVMGGVLCGILLGRAVGGTIGEHLGWRATFWAGAGVTAVAGIVLVSMLPRHAPRAQDSYGSLLRSLKILFARELELRRATAIQAMLFGSFIALWTSLTYHLKANAFRVICLI